MPCILATFQSLCHPCSFSIECSNKSLPGEHRSDDTMSHDIMMSPPWVPVSLVPLGYSLGLQCKEEKGKPLSVCHRCPTSDHLLHSCHFNWNLPQTRTKTGHLTCHLVWPLVFLPVLKSSGSLFCKLQFFWHLPWVSCEPLWLFCSQGNRVLISPFYAFHYISPTSHEQNQCLCQQHNAAVISLYSALFSCTWLGCPLKGKASCNSALQTHQCETGGI